MSSVVLSFVAAWVTLLASFRTSMNFRRKSRMSRACLNSTKQKACDRLLTTMRLRHCNQHNNFSTNNTPLLPKTAKTSSNHRSRFSHLWQQARMAFITSLSRCGGRRAKPCAHRRRMGRLRAAQPQVTLWRRFPAAHLRWKDRRHSDFTMTKSWPKSRSGTRKSIGRCKDLPICRSVKSSWWRRTKSTAYLSTCSEKWLSEVRG